MQRRDFLKGAVAAIGSGIAAGPVFGAHNPAVRWAPYQCLDLEAPEMKREEDIRRILVFATEFIPQTNTRRRAYDPRSPGDRNNERRLDGVGKRIHASELSISVPNTYSKAMAVKKGVARLLAADKDGAVREMLMVGMQFHTTSFDHPTDGISVPPGFRWEWVMTIPHEVAEVHRRAWLAAGYPCVATPASQLAAEKVKARGWPPGWLRVRHSDKTAEQYTIVPDLRIAECRAFFLDRVAMINRELGLANVQLGGKSGWFHGRAAVRNLPASPHNADPWLPSPYPGDSYRDANVLLVKEAVARFGAERVTWTNTGSPTAEERAAQGLPDYVSLADGGIRAMYDQWYGSRSTNWTLAKLLASGALT